MQLKFKKIVFEGDQGLYSAFFKKIWEIQQLPCYRRKGFIPLSDVYKKLCISFSLKKAIVRETLLLLREFGFINIISFNKIKLNFEVEDEK
jgi:hypothetical protein